MILPTDLPFYEFNLFFIYISSRNNILGSNVDIVFPCTCLKSIRMGSIRTMSQRERANGAAAPFVKLRLLVQQALSSADACSCSRHLAVQRQVCTSVHRSPPGRCCAACATPHLLVVRSAVRGRELSGSADENLSQHCFIK